MKSRPITPIDIKRPSTSIKKIRKPEKPVDALRSTTKQNEQYAATIAELETQRNTYMDALDDLNQRIIKDGDLIAGLRDRFQELLQGKKEKSSRSNQDNLEEEIKLSKEAEKAIIAFDSQHPSAYLAENPHILMDITSGTSNYFSEVAMNIESSITLGEYLVTSMEQLNSISRCLKAYESLRQCVRLNNFLETATETTKKVLQSEGTTILSSDLVSKDFHTVISTNTYYFSLDKDKSFPGRCINLKQSLIVRDPINDKLYSPSIDQILNPTNKTLLVSPIWDIGVLYIPQTSPFKKSFSRAEVLITEFYCQLLAPLLAAHIHYSHSIQLANHRRALQIFKTNLVPKNSLKALIPFLYQTIQECIYANDVEMYIINDDNFSKVTNEGKVDTNQYKLNGLPHYISEIKSPHVIDRVNERTPNYVQEVDEWALGNCFLGMPIISNGKVIAVLELSGKNGTNKFTQWDVDFVSVIVNCLALILPRCLQVFDKERDENIIREAAMFSEIVSEYTYSNMLSTNDICEKISYDVFKLIPCEYLLIATKYDNTIKTVITLKNGEKSDVLFINPEFLSMSLKANYSILSRDFTEVKDFRPMREIEYKEIVAVSRIYNDYCYAIVCLNTMDKLRNFTVVDKHMLEVLAQLCITSKVNNSKIHEKETIEMENLSFQNSLEVFKTVLYKEKQLQSLLLVFSEMINAHSFCLIEKNKSKNNFSILLSSPNVKICPPIPLDDVLSAMILSQPSHHIFIENINETGLDKSKFVELFKQFSSLVISPISTDQTYFIIFVTDNKFASNFNVLFDLYTPMITILLNIFLKTNHTDMIRKANQLKIDELSFYDHDLTSKSFSIEKYNDQQIIELLLRVFESLEINNVLCSKTPKIVKFLEEVSKLYKNNKYHNWNHAVETVQLCYSIVKRGKMSPRAINPMQTTALILACLLHDICHDGTSNEYHIKAKSSLYHVFGDDCPLENSSLTRSVRLLKSQPFFVCINNEEFWLFFKECLLATDIKKYEETIQNYQQCARNFDSKNLIHSVSLAKLVITVANISNVVRPFSQAQQVAENLETETDETNEKLRTLGIKEQTFVYWKCESDELPNIEMKFIQEVATPLIKAITGSFPELNDLNTSLEETKRNWQQIISNLE
ncbi:3'5'-cyclic nucleotide phosphodiesterase family protein [Trichomonas vaginalis G3]|uniref:Phosphodiesterase n=1 Tax=Trichomonas vaginalis (strain ATCC PRA-98 / G3) TaxID=412133 RepID=A2FET3_TRIV3|nr:3',5'-cyclic-nucleotide phosphodiesterase protein [Trichomonas vaginalis G3]EAX96580.1 3'5'-cyclic nucleotide phosphodiesterase family protein [Trichomonas vaginalis G3]KAI5485906.1 3',5'-cyclic-nucleotide phosphodiesterase protein [Trichomonas vaginalis G3]|eukprot:XP_001309510.1 3'5'-cyclic nucleotide phosphodiesterase family protein [Trichomonas vaginalis G3]